MNNVLLRVMLQLRAKGSNYKRHLPFKAYRSRDAPTGLTFQQL
jgi:hypothetical protein